MMLVEAFADAVRDPAAVLTTGTFDGVHIGHQAILGYLVARAQAVGGTPTVVTFDPHPREVILGEHVPLLTTIEERAELAGGLGVERMVVVPFTRAVASLEPEEYVRQILLDGVGMREAVVGFDHHFGRARRGNRALLEELGQRHGFTVDVIPEQVAAGSTVSSRRIRQLLLEAGDVSAAAELLGRTYSFDATVVPGDGRGKTIGYPTANLEPVDPRKIIPAAGVYAVRAELGAGRATGGMMNVGRRPTFEGDGVLRAEVHLFDIDEDLYGRPLRVHVIARLRDERRFGGVEELREQLGRDEEEARSRLAV
jgi:riboflavin kinase/FMN adenylyltransferase